MIDPTLPQDYAEHADAEAARLRARIEYLECELVTAQAHLLDAWLNRYFPDAPKPSGQAIRDAAAWAVAPPDPVEHCTLSPTEPDQARLVRYFTEGGL